MHWLWPFKVFLVIWGLFHVLNKLSCHHPNMERWARLTLICWQISNLTLNMLFSLVWMSYKAYHICIEILLFLVFSSTWIVAKFHLLLQIWSKEYTMVQSGKFALTNLNPTRIPCLSWVTKTIIICTSLLQWLIPMLCFYFFAWNCAKNTLFSSYLHFMSP